MRTTTSALILALGTNCAAQTMLLPNRVADINPSGASDPWDLTVAGANADQLIFACGNGIADGPDRRVHIARLNANTGAVDMINTTAGYQQLIAAGGDHLYFSLMDPPLLGPGFDALNAAVRWTRLSTTTSTTFPTAQVRGVYGNNGIVFGDKAIVRGIHSDANPRPFVVDPLSNSASLLQLIGAEAYGSASCEFTLHAGKVYFPGRSNNGIELHVTDGTAQGTMLVKDIMPLAGRSEPKELYSAGSRLYFSAKDSANDFEPWYTNGTSAGTVKLKQINPTGALGSDPRDFIALGNKVLFTANNGVNGRELWVTDGTTAGTTLVKDLKPGTTSSDPELLVLFGSKVWFVASDGLTLTRNLYATDGTSAGTVRMASAPRGSTIHDLVPCNRRLFYVTRATGTSKLWSIDATKTIREVKPAASLNADPIGRTSMAVMKDWLYFSGNFDNTGAELWKVQ